MLSISVPSQGEIMANYVDTRQGLDGKELSGECGQWAGYL